MANRAALILSMATPPDGADARVAHINNNSAGLFWYAAFGAEDLDAVGIGGWEARWRDLLVEEPDEATLAAAILWTPWSTAKARLDEAATRLATLPPELAPPWRPLFLAWRCSLITLATDSSAAWVGLDMIGIFAFHEDPAEMRRSTLDAIAPWRGVGPIELEAHCRPEELTGYTEDRRMSRLASGWPALPGAPPGPPAKPPRRPLRRPGPRDWLLVASFVVILAGVWVSYGSVVLTLATVALLVFGFLRILRQPG